MEVFDAVRTVLAVRSYQPTPVPPALVQRIVEAGRLTGSSMNQQPWHFVVVENRDTLRRLGGGAKTGSYVAQGRDRRSASPPRFSRPRQSRDGSRTLHRR
ncbi:MAG TPA: nitroreductase family protein [bacterium]|nr:nitroreductase family protein [bacterium]